MAYRMKSVQGQSWIDEDTMAEMYIKASPSSLMFFDVAFTNIAWVDTLTNEIIQNNDEEGFYFDDFLQFYVPIETLRTIKAEYPTLYFHDIATSLAFDTYLSQHPESIDISAHITLKNVWIEEVH